MKTFRLLWEIHKWIGIVLGTVIMLSAATGFLLLIKKDYDWIQPPTQRGTAGPPVALKPLHEVYAAVFALELPQFRSEADIERIDFRPGKRIHKVHSVHDNLEVQVDAISLKTFGPAERRSDWLESIHDGSWWGDWAHDWVMVVVAPLIIVLALTGYLLWLWPKWLKLLRRLKRG